MQIALDNLRHLVCGLSKFLDMQIKWEVGWAIALIFIMSEIEENRILVDN